MTRSNKPLRPPGMHLSRTDGVVHWRSSPLPPGDLARNIAVRSKHTCMGVNPLVLRLVARRLAQPESGWRPQAAARS